MVATFGYFRDSFPHGCLEGIALPISPLHEVEGAFYVSPDTGLEVELPASEYEVDTVSQPGWTCSRSPDTWARGKLRLRAAS